MRRVMKRCFKPKLTSTRRKTILVVVAVKAVMVAEVVEVEEDQMKGVRMEPLCVTIAKSQGTNGCSNHMCGNRSLFKEIDESKKSDVTLGDNKKIQVEGKCTVSITTRQDQSSHIVAKVELAKNKMFPLEVSMVEQYAIIANGDDETRL
ncbi:Retrovirus-related Pol polyprotein from transposon TNT 1-94 [Senna tora]|uniref:Retrovirus-related Pol polyprotein from transposon TNT 1-94 n=1 Tax=Senna tora TaxID=362788 RepID=A0A834TH96_9FABA|nr:Retrovirus-related Pol polyprotein from transposon TNT 1-94 [Senna tora]